jgi:hypothetical protein
MSDPRLDPASLAWGLSLGITFGMWLRGTLDALFLRPRQTSINDPDWRRSFNHENTNRPLGEPPLKFRRRTDKPQFPPPRITGP